MPGTTIKIRSRQGGEFDCYLSTPATEGQGPRGRARLRRAWRRQGHSRACRRVRRARLYRRGAGPVLAVGAGAAARVDDRRAAERSQPRLEKIKAGEADMADTLAEIRKLPQYNGRAAAMGFCYGGPYAILGPKRLGYDAGIACHGTQMLDFIQELDGVTAPICIIWGDQDHAAPRRGARCLSRPSRRACRTSRCTSSPACCTAS